jgi:hypothetical protein
MTTHTNFGSEPLVPEGLDLMYCISSSSKVIFCITCFLVYYFKKCICIFHRLLALFFSQKIFVALKRRLAQEMDFSIFHRWVDDYGLNQDAFLLRISIQTHPHKPIHTPYKSDGPHRKPRTKPHHDTSPNLAWQACVRGPPRSISTQEIPKTKGMYNGGNTYLLLQVSI